MLHPAVRAALAAEAPRHAELHELLSQADVLRDPNRLKTLLLESGRLEKRMRRFHELEQLERSAAEADTLAETERDAELQELARTESQELKARAARLSEQLQSEALARHRFSD